MTTAIQAVAEASLSPRQRNSIRALQRNVESAHYYGTGVRVSPAQFAALQTAWDAAKASGLPIAPLQYQQAKLLGLK